jgi:hypothetical protein
MGILDSLPHLATAKRRKRVRKNNGFVDSYEVLFENRPCWVQTDYDFKIEEYRARGQDLSAVIYFTENPHLSEKDIVYAQDEIYEVNSASVPDTSAGLGVVFRVTVGKTTTGSTV